MEASSPTSARSSARVPSPRIRRSTRTRRRSMSGPDRQRALEQYRRRARGYDRLAPVTLRLRRRAVERLLLGQGQTVLDVACSTGLTFGLIEDQIGPDGHLIGIDLSPEMLSQARERVAANGWRNVTLIESAIEDASIPEVAGAAVFVLTHDVMRSPEALGNVLAHVRPGGRISAAGGKRAPAWPPRSTVARWTSSTSRRSSSMTWYARRETRESTTSPRRRATPVRCRTATTPSTRRISSRYWVRSLMRTPPCASLRVCSVRVGDWLSESHWHRAIPTLCCSASCAVVASMPASRSRTAKAVRWRISRASEFHRPPKTSAE